MNKVEQETTQDSSEENSIDLVSIISFQIKTTLH